MRMLRSPVTGIVLLAILLAVPLPVLTPAQAQLNGPEGQGNQDGDVWIYDDPVGDPAPYGINVLGPNPVGEQYAHIDIIQAIIGEEDTDSYEIALKFGARGPQTTVLETLAITDLSCRLEWYFNGRDGARYWMYFTEQITVNVDEPTDDEFYYYLDRRIDSGERYDYESGDDAVHLTYDPELPGVRLTLDKDFTIVYPSFTPPADGDQITDLEVDCETDVSLYGRMGDWFNAPESYGFVDPGAGEIVSVRFGAPQTLGQVGIESEGESVQQVGGAPDEVGLAPGAATIVPLTLHNNDDRKRIVTLSASALDADDQELDWNVTISPTTEVKAADVRPLNLIVTVPSDAILGHEVKLVVDLEVLGADAPGRAARDAKITPVLSTTANTLYLHTDLRRSFVPDDPTGLFNSWEYGMSLVRDDEEWSDGKVDVVSTGCRSDSFEMPALSRPVRLDPNGMFHLELMFESDHAGAPFVYFGFGTDATGYVDFQGQLSSGEPQVIERGIFEDQPLLWPAGTVLYGYLSVCNPPFDQERSIDVRWDPTRSFITLPIAEDVEQELSITDGTYLPALSLVAGEDRDAYINPGKTYTWELLLANDGVETDDLRVSVEMQGDMDGWKFQLQPGARFRVPAGNSTPLGVVVTAAPDAQELDLVNLTIVATSEKDEAAQAKIKLAAIVTTQVEFDDKTYEDQEGQLAPLVDESEESPGFAVVPLVGVGLLFVARLRRRA